MSYEVTATRKRPQIFDELTGQEFVVSTLKNSIKKNRIAHAYLFSGPRGVGKTSAARILAKALNCEEGPTDKPCGDCSCCAEITKGSSLDVIEIDGASNTSVNDVREIKDEVLFAPNSSRYKIYIIDEVHMLSNSAFNALLKTIEEPPPYIVFIFATTEIHKVPATIRSRCQQFNFRLIPADTIAEQLKTVTEEMGINAEEEALYWIAKEATGSLRDAYTLFDQVASFSDKSITIQGIREKLGLVGFERINELAEVFASGDSSGSLEKTDNIIGDGVSVEQFIIDLAEYFRNLLFVKSGITRQAVLGYAPDRFSKQCLDTFTIQQLEHSLQLLFELYRNIRFSLNPKYELELTIVRLSNLRLYIPPENIVKELGTLQKALFNSKNEAAPGEPENYQENKNENPTVFGEVPWESIVSKLKKTKVALYSVLQQVKRTKIEGDTLVIYFPSVYTANSVRQEIQTVSTAAQEVLGKKVSISIEIEKEESEADPVIKQDEKVELVKKIFKGEIVQGGEV